MRLLCAWPCWQDAAPPRTTDDETAKTYENCIDRNTPGMIRVSFGIYNNEEEVDQFLKILESVLDASRLATKADSLAIPGF